MVSSSQHDNFILFLFLVSLTGIRCPTPHKANKYSTVRSRCLYEMVTSIYICCNQYIWSYQYVVCNQYMVLTSVWFNPYVVWSGSDCIILAWMNMLQYEPSEDGCYSWGWAIACVFKCTVHSWGLAIACVFKHRP